MHHTSLTMPWLFTQTTAKCNYLCAVHRLNTHRRWLSNMKTYLYLLECANRQANCWLHRIKRGWSQRISTASITPCIEMRGTTNKLFSGKILKVDIYGSRLSNGSNNNVPVYVKSMAVTLFGTTFFTCNLAWGTGVKAWLDCSRLWSANDCYITSGLISNLQCYWYTFVVIQNGIICYVSSVS